ncbi:unnamed protein product [Paramecium octaurelia]|uniref:Microtubule-associated protein Jupiter n=1 Tax=Paramecium octaurelia TaxID=43137 RepID=A0A8S1SFX3_PAROT|nr:unnamed protein product [Paramecium octaurelia]
MNNIQGYSLSKPSTKTTQAPGGNSSISFGSDEPAPQQKRAVRDPNASQFTLGGDPVPQKGQQQQQQQQQQQDQGAHTSVKVKNPPGGRSQIQFG